MADDKLKLSDIERSQLGTRATKTKRYISSEDWPLLREDIVSRRSAIFPDEFKLNPELTAYTPGETLDLLEHEVVQDWHNKMLEYKIPEKYKTVILVPCAVTKPWGAQHCGRSSYYKAYHAIKEDVENGLIPGPIFFVTISEPLGIVPEDMWDEFPAYDNPGLFKDTPQRTGLNKRQWEASRFKEPHVMPFDPEAKALAIKTLSYIISEFLANNKAPGRRFISFVDYRPGSSLGTATHSLMLDQAQGMLDEVIVEDKDRFPKNEHAYQGVSDNNRGRGLRSYMRESISESILSNENPDDSIDPKLSSLKIWFAQNGHYYEASCLHRILKNAAIITELEKDIGKDEASQMEALESRYFPEEYAQDAADILDDMTQPGAAGGAYLDDKTNQIGGYLYGYELVFEDELHGENIDIEDFDCFDQECAQAPYLFAEELTRLAKNGGIFYVSNFLIDRPYRMRINDLIFGLLSEIKKRGYSYMAFDALSDTYRLIMKDNMPNKAREEKYNIKVLGKVDRGSSLFLARIN